MATKKKNIDEVLRMNMESTDLDDEGLDDEAKEGASLGDEDDEDDLASDDEDEEE